MTHFQYFLKSARAPDIPLRASTFRVKSAARPGQPPPGLHNRTWKSRRPPTPSGYFSYIRTCGVVAVPRAERDQPTSASDCIGSRHRKGSSGVTYHEGPVQYMLCLIEKMKAKATHRRVHQRRAGGTNCPAPIPLIYMSGLALLRKESGEN